MSAHRQCNTTTTAQDCLAGTTCGKHGALNLCIPSDLSGCTKVDPLFVAPINNVYTLFCDEKAVRTVPPASISASLPCASFETTHSGVCLLPACSAAQQASGSTDCWLEQLPSGATAAPTVPEANRLHHGCKSDSDCKTPGTGCVKHGSLDLCVPTDRSQCTAVDPLFVAAVDNVFTMFCNSNSPIPDSALNKTCEAYESSHGGLCLLSACTDSAIAAGATDCWLEALPGTTSTKPAGIIEDSGLSSGAKAGIAIAVVVVVGAIGLIGLNKIRRSRRKMHHSQVLI
ncbi:hypothetical protein DFS34DRAFT_437073 [Phlyctochytrium arcticum]|nr:hypothetical protein DFS34DRAFT_437073 [Phlyctochytrium arcticum]